MIQDIIAKLQRETVTLQAVLVPYYEDLDNAEVRIKLKGKTIGEANKEHGSWFFTYNVKRRELEALSNWYEAKVAAARGRLFKKFTENFSIELSDRAKDKYIDKEAEYLTVYEDYLTVKELEEAYKAVVEAFEQRGYSLRNITDLRVAGLDDTLL